MAEQRDEIREQIQTWAVNDYFTPNIKAEVIFDTLLTPCLTEILREQLEGKLDGLTFLTKEMPIREKDGGKKVLKVDYVLADQNNVYLVELKTVGSSISRKQAKDYREICQEKSFGEILGRRLLSILAGDGKTFALRLGDASLWGDQTLTTAFYQIIGKKKYRADAQGTTCAEKAAALIRAQEWAQLGRYRSRKYLYTLGQLVDYLDQGGKLWDKPMTVLYLTPDGISPDDHFRGLSLQRFAGNSGPYAEFLAEIFERIYGKRRRNA